MNDIQDLVGKFSGINVVAMSVIGDKGNVQGANVGYQRKSLQEMVLLKPLAIMAPGN